MGSNASGRVPDNSSTPVPTSPSAHDLAPLAATTVPRRYPLLMTMSTTLHNSPPPTALALCVAFCHACVCGCAFWPKCTAPRSRGHLCCGMCALSIWLVSLSACLHVYCVYDTRYMHARARAGSGLRLCRLRWCCVRCCSALQVFCFIYRLSFSHTICAWFPGSGMGGVWVVVVVFVELSPVCAEPP
jgi:hypothetical protein